MADDDDEVVVTIEPEGQTREANGRFAGPTDDDAVKDLKSQFEEQRTAREAAERRASEATDRERRAREEAQRAREEATTAKTQVADSQLETVSSGLAAAESEAVAAEQAYAAAMEAGNFAEAAKAQRRMARAEAETVALSQAKSDLEARKSARPATDTRKETTDRTGDRAVDPNSDEDIRAKYTRPTAEWLLQHRDMLTDPRKSAKLTAAHHNAISEGLQPDTAEYFSHVESFVGLRKTGSDNGTGNGQARSQPKPRRSSVPAAPVTASSGGTSGGGPEVRLTPAEALSATDGTLVWNYDDPTGQKRFKKGDVLGLQEVARRKLARLRERGNENPYIES